MAFKQIVVPLDGSGAAEAAIPHAARLARAFGARVLLLRVLDAASAGQSPDSIDWRMQKAEATRYLQELAALQTLADLPISVELNEGRPADCVIDTAERVGADLIVMSAHGTNGPSGCPFGSTAHKILGAAGTSVVIVGGPAEPGENGAEHYRRVLVPIDGSQQADMALQFAVAMAASSEHMEIVVLHLVAAPLMPRRGPLSPEEQSLHDQVIAANARAAEHHLQDIQRQFRNGVSIACRLEVSANPVQTIARAAGVEQADLLIMTCPERGETQRLCRLSICETVQIISELPLVILQSSGR
jgi:nucleotide-binding universal stress UspA family protein